MHLTLPALPDRLSGRLSGRLPLPRGRVGVVVTSLALAATLAACGGEDDAPDAVADPTSPPAATTTAASATVGPISLTDDTGAPVELDAPATRIACLTMICVDALTEVGLTPVAYRDQLALDPRYAGPDAEMREIRGGFGEENVEDIALAQPEVVIGLGGAQDGLRAAVEKIAPLYLVDPRSWQDSVAFLRTVGELTGTEEAAEQAASAFEDRVAAVSAERVDLTTLSMFGEPGSLGVDSVETPVGSLLAEVSDYPWPAAADPFAPVSVEQIAQVDPDLVFAQTFSAGDDSVPLPERLAEDPVWRTLTASENGDVVEVEAAVWATGRGTISLGLVLDEAEQRLGIS